VRVQLFADGADLDALRFLASDERLTGFTTNPTLMRKAGVTDYLAFAREALAVVAPRPLSLEVLADDWGEMARQARVLSNLAPNAWVKIPCSTCDGKSTMPLVRRLAAEGIRLNVTAILTLGQVREASKALGSAPGFISVFAGRIADTGRDPVPLMAEAVKILALHPKQALIWASPRELLNVIQAAEVGCHVITVTPDLLAKLPLVGRDLESYSLETVRMFYADGVAAGYRL